MIGASRLAQALDLPRSILKRIALLLMAALVIRAGIAHFTNPGGFVSIMPPYLPAHLALVYLSGVLEIIGGIGALFSRTRRFAGWGLIALLIVVFPANLYMAMNPEVFSTIPVWALYARLPLQIVLIAWVWWVTLHHEPIGEQATRF